MRAAKGSHNAASQPLQERRTFRFLPALGALSLPHNLYWHEGTCNLRLVRRRLILGLAIGGCSPHSFPCRV